MANGASFTLDTRGIDGLIANLPDRIDAFLRATAEEIVTDVKLSINDISVGRTEVRYGPRRTVTVSKEGDAPNTDTGALINSIGWKKVGKYAYWIHDGVLYGYALEDIMNRPFIQPAFEKHRASFAADAKKWGLVKI